MKIINKTYNISSNLNKKIILISDLHYQNKKDIKRLNYILDNIKKLNPNYICIPGDIIDRSNIQDEDLFLEWLKKLSNITKVIMSIGNHEFYIKKFKKTFGLNHIFYKKLSKIKNVYILDNKNIVIDSINFIGVTIPIEYYIKKKNNFNTLLDKLKTYKKYYNILLCHSPIDISSREVLKNRNIDLVLCGHMHGGVVPIILRPIFKTRGLLSPNKRLFPKNAYGSVKINNTNIVITSGTKVTPYNKLNILFKPEIVTIKLTFNKKSV